MKPKGYKLQELLEKKSIIPVKQHQSPVFKRTISGKSSGVIIVEDAFSSPSNYDHIALITSGFGEDHPDLIMAWDDDGDFTIDNAIIYLGFWNDGPIK